MKKKSTDHGFILFGGTRLAQRSKGKVGKRWRWLLACAIAMTVGGEGSSVAFADYYTATISSCESLHSSGASLYSRNIFFDQCTGSVWATGDTIVFSDILYYPYVTITTHHSDGTVSVQKPIRAVIYTDNCNLSIIGDPSCLPESSDTAPNPDLGKPDCPTVSAGK